MLHLAGVLGAAVDPPLVLLQRHRVGDLALQVEVLLAADLERALQPVRRARQRRHRVAAAHVHRRQHIALLFVGLLRRGAYRPAPGWWRFVLQVVAASAVLAIYLLWASTGLSWLGVPGGAWARVLQLLLVLGGAATLYFVVLLLGGVKLREFVRK